MEILIFDFMEIEEYFSDNPNLKDFLESKEFENCYDNLVNNVLFPLLIEINNPKMFDDCFQWIFKNPDLTFFQELEELIKNAYKTNETKIVNLISNFLEIPAIDLFKKSDIRKLISSIKMAEEMIDVPEKLKNEEFNINKFIEFILTFLPSLLCYVNVFKNKKGISIKFRKFKLQS